MPCGFHRHALCASGRRRAVLRVALRLPLHAARQMAGNARGLGEEQGCVRRSVVLDRRELPVSRMARGARAAVRESGRRPAEARHSSVHRDTDDHRTHGRDHRRGRLFRAELGDDGIRRRSGGQAPVLSARSPARRVFCPRGRAACGVETRLRMGGRRHVVPQPRAGPQARKPSGRMFLRCLHSPFLAGGRQDVGEACACKSDPFGRVDAETLERIFLRRHGRTDARDRRRRAPRLARNRHGIPVRRDAALRHSARPLRRKRKAHPAASWRRRVLGHRSVQTTGQGVLPPDDAGRLSRRKVDRRMLPRDRDVPAHVRLPHGAGANTRSVRKPGAGNGFRQHVRGGRAYRRND